MFMLEYPLTGDDIGMGQSRNETPGTIINQSLVLIHHHSTPIRISEGAVIVSRNRRGVRGGVILALRRRWKSASL